MGIRKKYLPDVPVAIKFETELNRLCPGLRVKSPIMTEIVNLQLADQTI